MAAGVPPVAALATNKLQSTIGTGSAFLTFWRAGHVDLRRFAWPAAGAFAGSVLGATAVQYVGSDFLAAFVPILLIAMGLYFLLAPPMSSVDRRARTGPLGLTLIRSEEHTSELQSLMRISSAVFCLKKNKCLLLI